MNEQYYPESQSPLRADLPRTNQVFADLREAFLLNYRPSTAKAYWGDLQHFHEWSTREGVDPVRPEADDLRSYRARLAADGYSPSTVRRRIGTLRAFYVYLASAGAVVHSQVLAELIGERE